MKFGRHGAKSLPQLLKEIRQQAGLTADQWTEQLDTTEHVIYEFEGGQFTSQRLLTAYGELARKR